jgi:5-methylcytosine-specific restriction protein B
LSSQQGGHGVITDVSEGTILDAMKRFDKEYRNNADWLNWQNNKNHKYAIQRDGRLYPVKQIISMATGQPVSSFSGGDESNNYLANKGFKIVNISPENETEQENGDNSELQVRSWSRPAGIPNLIGRKKVDWSIFIYGSQIPVDFHQFFEAANGGKHLEKGESHEVQLIIEGQTFSATIYNIKVRKTESDTLQLRWDGNNDLKDLLISRLSNSYTYLVNERKIKEESGSSSYIKIPDYKAEYIDFISTDAPFTYLINFITVDNHPNIWWVNQGSSLTAEREKGILFAPLRSRGGRVIHHWETMKDLKVGDIVVHYANNALRYVSKITSTAIETENPSLTDEHQDYERGRLAKTNYYELNPIVDIKEIAQKILELDIPQGPIDSTGRVKQGYLFRFNHEGLKYIQEAQPSTAWPEWASFDTDIDDGNTKTELDYSAMVSSLIDHIASQGYIFEPWQIATYVTALRTKPFVILAGVSGTGKSKLPALISEATGGNCHLIPVRPDWTDSSDVLGYCDLQGQFKPGSMLSIVREAANNPDSHFVCIMDEMNLARVEHYFAEVLSQVENRQADSTGKFFSGPLICQDLREEDEEWGQQVLPPNLAIVSTVNMDESAYGFSRKVLDRAFTLELSEIHLESWGTKIDKTPDINVWPVKLWFPRAINLNGLQDISVEDKQKIDEVIMVLTEVNTILIQAQLQVGYRVRDEVALFVLHAEEIIDSFVTTNKMQVNPLDLALQMKILPRIIGGSIPIRKVMLQLLGWAAKGSKNISEEDAQKIIEDWDKNGRLTFLEKARYPRTAARLCLMWERLVNEGFTSFWM